MGKPFPKYPEEVTGGDEPSVAPTKTDHSILAAERGTQHTKRIETDEDGNLYVNVAQGSIDITVGEVEVKNDIGNPVPVSGTVSVGNFPSTQNVAITSTVETEIKNDAGNPIPVSGTVTANAGTGPFPVSDGGGSLTVDGTFFQATQPVSAASLPLPSGASTEVTLAAIKAKTDNLDVALSTRTKPSDVQLVDGSGVTQPVSGTVGVSNFPAVQPVSDNGGSLTVDGVFFQVTQPVSAASLPLPSGAATSALQTQPGVDIGDVTVNNTSGSSAVNVQDGGNSLTVDGAVSVSNFPTTQGISVDGVSSASLSNVGGSASSIQLLASNASRKLALFFNDSASACYLKMGTTASTTSFTVKISALGYYELPLPVYTGKIDAIWDTGVGSMRITEL